MKTSRNVALADPNEFIRRNYKKRNGESESVNYLPSYCFREEGGLGDTVMSFVQNVEGGGGTLGDAGAHKREARMNRLRRAHGTNRDIKSLLPSGTRRYRYPTGARPI